MFIKYPPGPDGLQGGRFSG